ncbi:MAG: hypothetical protein ACOY71_05730, partial [Gemmatimonadota bacterium]
VVTVQGAPVALVVDRASSVLRVEPSAMDMGVPADRRLPEGAVVATVRAGGRSLRLLRIERLLTPDDRKALGPPDAGR